MEFAKRKLRNMLMVFPTMYETARATLAVPKVFLHLVLLLNHDNMKG